jgi:tight adherence protein B
MKINLILSAILLTGAWIAVITYYFDIDLFKIKALNDFIVNIKENNLITIGIITLGIFLSILTKVIIVAPAFVILGLLTPGLLLRRKNNKSTELKMNQWLVLIDEIASGVRAGLTISESLSQSLNKSEEPLRQDLIEAVLEFNRSGQVSNVMKILQTQISDPVGIATLKLLAIVLKTGSNDLATSLNILSNTSRENINLIQELKAKQAWVLNGAKISIIAPWVVLLTLWTQESVRTAYQNFMGQIILLLIAVIGIVGYVVMKKIGKIDVGSQAHLT